jgi:antitoxin component of MazEF toxin-antitoxin module
MEEADQFIGNVIKIGNSFGIVIPVNNIDFSGLKEGDKLKVWYKKKEE